MKFYPSKIRYCCMNISSAPSSAVTAHYSTIALVTAYPKRDHEANPNPNIGPDPNPEPYQYFTHLLYLLLITQLHGLKFCT